MDWRTPACPSPVPGWEDTCFIPCASCQNEDIDKLKTLIAERRIVPQPFPSNAKADTECYPSVAKEVAALVDECSYEIEKYN